MYGLVLQPVMLFVISCSKSQGRDCQGVRVVTARSQVPGVAGALTGAGEFL
jgi:hypothetical protein